MPQGDKSAYTSKQERQARYIEKGYERRGVSEKESARRAWATVNKQTGGGLKRKTAKTAGKKAGAKKTATKKTATKKTATKKTATKKTATKKTATKKAAGKRVAKQATKKAARRSAR